MKIAVVAPGRPVLPEVAERVTRLAAERWDEAVELSFHPQCFLSEGHFAGSDRARAEAFAEAASDRSADAVWFGRGGYGAARMVDAAMAALGPAAARKRYLGYSDGGVLLAALHGAGIGRPAHGPLVDDVRRDGGEATVLRALAWLVEEVAEPTYRTDRMLGQLFQHAGVRRLAGVRMGRFSQVQPNDPDFGRGEREIVEEWCRRAGVPFLGTADIGHDADNKVVPFAGLEA